METSRPIEVTRARTVLGVHHSRPTFSVPAGACDCHVHIFGTRDRYPFSPDRVFMPGEASVSDVLEMHRALGIEKLVVVQASPHGTDNRCLVDSLYELSRLGVPARGVAVVSHDISVAELTHLHEAGVRGIRVNLQSYGNEDSNVAAESLAVASTTAASMGWHVQTYTNLRVVQGAQDAIRAMPVPLVLDHFGLAMVRDGIAQPGFSDLLSLVRSGKVFVKLSAPYRILVDRTVADGAPIVRALVDAGLDQLLWGTDWPHTGPWPGKARLRDEPEPFHPIDDGLQLDILAQWTTEAEREAILVRNPTRLYDF